MMYDRPLTVGVGRHSSRAAWSLATVAFLVCCSPVLTDPAFGDSLPKFDEPRPSFRSAPPDAIPISLGLSSGQLIYVSPRISERSLEMLPVKQGVLLAGVFGEDPREWSDDEVASRLAKLIESEPRHVLISDRRARKSRTLELPHPEATTAYLACISLDGIPSGSFSKKKAIDLLRQDFRKGAYDIVVGALSIDLATKVVAFR